MLKIASVCNVVQNYKFSSLKCRIAKIVYNIRRIIKYFTNDATNTSVHFVVIGRLDYCNSLLYSAINILGRYTFPRNKNVFRSRIGDGKEYACRFGIFIW